MSEQPGTIGPYRILELLGQGGMGVVYRCEHLRTGRLAAVKTVSVAHAGLLNRIRREIHALARTRHPGIVPIVEHGAEAGLPWYAMELVEGVTLRKFWSRMTGRAEAVTPGGVSPETVVESSATHTAEAAADHARTASPFATAVRRGPEWRPPDEPLLRTAVRPAGDPTLKPTVPEIPAHRPQAAAGRLGEALRLIWRLCAPLAYLHGEGLVHRDIKPANIIVRPDGWPVLVDFGLMAQSLGPAGREVLEEEGETVGTTAYMAPEQIRGDLVDARADLYALGCILYELVAGRVPFTGRTLGEVLYQHCEVAPAALSRVAEGVPSKLDLLVARLLAKEPHERLGYADDVAAALQTLGVAEPAEAQNPTPRPYLYRPRLAGREKTLYEVRRRLDRLETGSGGLVLIGGESGVGKTRLVMEVARQARVRRINVYMGECLRESNATLQPLRRTLQAVADRCRERGPAETQRLVGGRLALLSLHEPALRTLTEGAPPVLPELSPEASRRRLFEELAATLEALAKGKGPENGESPISSLVLILDDLQWADALTLDFLQFLVERRRLEETGLLVLGTYRTEELEPGVARLLESPETRSLRLERLESRNVSAMVQDMLAMSQSPARFVQALATQSEGNPFFVAEYLRTVIADGALTRDAEGRWQLAQDAGDALPLPRALRELVLRRFERLGPAARSVLDACSVLGRELDPALLAHLADLGDHERLDALGELLARQVLEEGTAGRLRFVHDKLREVAYDGIECPRRETLHRAAAEAIGKQPPELRDEMLATLAEHWEAAGELAEAARSYLAAARRARGRYAHKEAERLYREFLRVQERPNLLGIEARDELAMSVLNLQGRPAEAFAELRLGLQEARRLEDRGAESRLLRSLAIVTEETGHLEEAREMTERALALAVEAQNRWHEFKALETLATIHYQEGASEQARQLLEQALAICRADGHRHEEAVLVGTLGSVQFQQGALEEARELHEQALTLKRRAGDVRGEGLSLTNLAEVLVSLGRLEEADGLLDQALALKRSAGDRRGEGITLLSMAQLHGDAGRPVEARRFVEAALPILQAVESRQFEGLAIGYQAVLERRYGDLGEAARLEAQAELILLEVGDRANLAVCVAQRGLAALAQGELAEAQAALTQVRGLAGTEVKPATDLARALSGLERAIAVAQAGGELYRGEVPEAMSKGLREWFDRAASGQSAVTGQRSAVRGKQ